MRPTATVPIDGRRLRRHLRSWPRAAGEPDAEAISEEIERYESAWSSELLEVELRRVAFREEIEQGVEQLLAAVTLLALDSDGLRRASAVPPRAVRTLDAIHLQAAVELHRDGRIEAALTFDHQLQAGCAHHGLRLATVSQST